MTRIAAHGAELLVHDATFSDEEADARRRDRALDRRQAAELAAEAGVAMLALVHISSRYHVGPCSTRPARPSRTPTPCATSTWSRSPSPNGASRA